MKTTHPPHHHRAGFTMIEITIVAGLTTMLVVAAVALLLSSIVSSGRTNTLQFVKENGDYALGQIEFLLRNATDILGSCTSSMNQITVRNIDGGVTTLMREEQNGVAKIASNSGRYLTSDAVILVAGPTFDCYQSPDGLIRSVTAAFTLRRGEVGIDRASEVLSQDFQTTVTLRNF